MKQLTLNELITHHCACEQNDWTKATVEALRELYKLKEFERQRTNRTSIPVPLRSNPDAKSWHWNEHNYEETKVNEHPSNSPTPKRR